MATCKWCGRYFKDGKGYGSTFFTGQKYCSERCYMEHEASKNPHSQPSYSGQELAGQSGGGCLSFIGKIIKWIIIIAIVIFVLVAIFAE